MVASDHLSSVSRSDVGGRKTSGLIPRLDHARLVYAATLTAVYAELHCHSAYSFLDGASPPDELLAEAHRLGYPALALTDRNGVYGSPALAHGAPPLDIQAITGAEVT